MNWKKYVGKEVSLSNGAIWTHGELIKVKGIFNKWLVLKSEHGDHYMKCSSIEHFIQGTSLLSSRLDSEGKHAAGITIEQNQKASWIEHLNWVREHAYECDERSKHHVTLCEEQNEILKTLKRENS